MALYSLQLFVLHVGHSQINNHTFCPHCASPSHRQHLDPPVRRIRGYLEGEERQ